MDFQKGLGRITALVRDFAASGDQAQIVVLGQGGDPAIAAELEALAQAHPALLRFIDHSKVPFDPETQRQLAAGATLGLMPSRFEPFGLADTVFSLNLAPAVVAWTGGLKDKHRPFDPATGRGNAFVFENSADEARATAGFIAQTRAAIALWRDDPVAFDKLLRNVAEGDPSWTRRAPELVAFYRKIANAKARRRAVRAANKQARAQAAQPQLTAAPPPL